MSMTAKTFENLPKWKNPRPSLPKKAMEAKGIAESGAIAIIVASLAIARRIVGRKVAEKRARS